MLIQQLVSEKPALKLHTGKQDNKTKIKPNPLKASTLKRKTKKEILPGDISSRRKFKYCLKGMVNWRTRLLVRCCIIEPKAR
jgi:CRISPR/Cas system-associated protein Cas5 (RAMP superfamily)